MLKKYDYVLKEDSNSVMLYKYNYNFLFFIVQKLCLVHLYNSFVLECLISKTLL